MIVVDHLREQITDIHQLSEVTAQEIDRRSTMATKHNPECGEGDDISARDSASQCGSSTSSVSERAQRAGNRAKIRAKHAAMAKQEEIADEERLLNLSRDRVQAKRKAFDVEIEMNMADAEDEAINQVEDEEAGRINPAPPAATTTTVPPAALSLPPPLSAAAENATQQQTQEASGLKLVSEPYMRESESSRAVAGGAIPKRPPPGLQLPAAGIVHSSAILDISRAPSASYAGVGVRGVDTAVSDTVRSSPALVGGVSAPMPTLGYTHG